MTLQNCRKRLELAKSKENTKEIKFWEDRIAHKLRLTKYAQVKPIKDPVVEEPKEVKEIGKKPKRQLRK